MELTPEDEMLRSRLSADFVPPQSFDAHAHLYDVRFTDGAGSAMLEESAKPFGRAAYARQMKQLFGDRPPLGGLFFPFPYRTANTAAQNDYLQGELADDPHSRGLLLITPQCDPAEVARRLEDRQMAGFKVYHCYATSTQPTFDAGCDEFIPEWAWELADQRGLAIMLHMVKRRAVADGTNQRYIREHCRRYRGAKLILAHAARGFCARHTVEGIAALRGLDNVWFDTSAVCEAAAFEAILRVCGPTRLLFGTDAPVSHMRARCVSIGDGFLWTGDVHPQWEKSAFAKPTLVGLESLLALQQACQTCHLSTSDIELVFGAAARQMLGIAPLSPPTDVQQQYRHAKQLIPGGTQLLSKRPELFAPDTWPAYYREARGCEIIDTSGRRLIDMSTGGILATVLGYADPDVNAAVMRRVQFGSMATLQTYDEVELAELLVAIHPWAQMARFTRTGGEAMAVAVRIARAATGRDVVAICGYHGWHDWYLAANLPPEGAAAGDALSGHLLPGLEPVGVPRALAGTARTFRYNQLDELDAILADTGGRLAAIVMETTRHAEPEPGFLEGVRQRATQAGAALVFDEISIGWRLCLGGAHLKYQVEPDLAVFAKTISNGFAMGAVIGRGEVMQAAQRSFISSAYWTEGIGPAAGVATVKKLMRIDVPAHLRVIGDLVRQGWNRLAEKHRLPITAAGRPELALLKIDHPEAAALTTLLTVRMLERGFLASGYFNPMLAHEPYHVETYLAALDEVFAELAETIERGDLARRLKTPVKHTGFARLTG